MKNTCPNCKKEDLDPFYSVESVPVHSVLLMDTRKEALNYTKRDIQLGYCSNCGFISNFVFEADVQEYSAKCEETQGFSGTFNKFHEALANRLIAKHDLHNKVVLEIGCGKGDFVTMLCYQGDNRGYGFDPAFVPERNPDKEDRVEFITDFYSEKYSDYKADFICCKMTLEHIPDTFDFVRVVRNAIGDNTDTIVFFQIPEAKRVLADIGFWDIYYEHCSYFSASSLEYLFKATGFEVLEIATEYDDQYIMIEAKPVVDGKIADEKPGVDTSDINRAVVDFRQKINDHLARWRTLISTSASEGKKIVLWGGGSKAVAFLTTLGIGDEISYAVDINPYKHGYFLPGSGQEVVSPQFLVEYNPDLVIVMNPIYMDEISRDLNKLGLQPELLPIDFMTQKFVEPGG